MSTPTHGKVRYEDSGVPHPWPQPKPSLWPLLGALAAGLTAALAVIFMHHGKIGIGGLSFDPGVKGPLLGFAALVAVMGLWWRDVLREAAATKAQTPAGTFVLRYGMALFIASEVMFFVAFFWAYYNSAFFPAASIGGTWPPATIKTFNPLEMPFFMTLILLLSGTSVTWAHQAVLTGQRRALVQALGVTVALGFSFSLCQAYEYHHAQFGMTSGIFGSTFYLATGLHGLHVIIGTIFLGVCLLRARKGHFTPERHFGLTAAAWYWHFVDVVWLFLFLSVYCYGSRG